jgi:enoyl-CoA hydratase/carnithine racemase
MKTFKNIILSKNNNGISRIILNDSKTYNSLSLSTINSLIAAFKTLEKDKKTKVIIIEGAGKGFSAGHNLNEIQSLKNKTSYQKLFNQCSKLMMNIINHNKPVIAKVHGAAFAAGCQLVASCDLAFSSKEAIFSTPGVNIGLFCSTPMVALSRKVSKKKAMQMLLTGEPIKASYAKEIGLINDCFTKSKLETEIMKIAKIISSKSSVTLNIGKGAFYKQLEMPLDKAYKYTSKIMTENMMTADANEGIKSFLEKRSPIWKNK